MAGEQDIRFVREGRSLAQWLPQLVADQADVRLEAGNAIAAMHFNQASVHSEYEHDGMSPEQAERYRVDWSGAVEQAVERMGGDEKRVFLFSLATLHVAMHEAYIQEMNAENTQFDRIMKKIEERIDSLDNDKEKREQLKRMGRALCASIARTCDEESEPESLSMTGMAMAWVIPAIGKQWMDVPEALHVMLNSGGNRAFAYDAIRAAGLAAAPHFLDMLIDQFRQAEHQGYFDESRTLAEVGRGNPQVVAMLLDALRTWPADRLWPATSALFNMGRETRAHEGTLPALLELLHADEGGRRAAAACVLGPVASGIDDAIAPLLDATHDPFVDLNEGVDVRLVANCAMTSLGIIAQQPEKVVPRLCELFTTYKEHDTDMSYGGKYARVCEALEHYGGNALPVMPIVLKLLKKDLRRDPGRWWHADLLTLLGKIGPLAEEALPVLEELEAKWQMHLKEEIEREETEWDDDDNEPWDEDEQGDDQDDEPEVSDILRVIRSIRGQA